MVGVYPKGEFNLEMLQATFQRPENSHVEALQLFPLIEGEISSLWEHTTGVGFSNFLQQLSFWGHMTWAMCVQCMI